MYSPSLIIFFALLLYKTTEAAVYIYGPEDKPPEFADQKGCYLSSLNIVLEIDVPYSPQDGENCIQYTCRENGETQVFTCGAIGKPEGCEEVEDNKNLPYPDCCKTIRCPNEDGTYSYF